MNHESKFIFLYQNPLYVNICTIFNSKIKNPIMSLHNYYKTFDRTKINTIISYLFMYLQIIYAMSINYIYKCVKYKNIKLINGTEKNTCENIYLQFLILLSFYKIEKMCYVLFNKKNKECFILKNIRNIFNNKYDIIHMDILYQNKSISVIIDKNSNISNKLYETIEYIEKNKKFLEKNKLSLNSIMTCANILDKSHKLIYNMKCIFDKYSTNKIFNNTINNVLLFNDVNIENGDVLEIKIFGNTVDDNQFKSYKVDLAKIKDLNIIDLYEYVPIK